MGPAHPDGVPSARRASRHLLNELSAPDNAQVLGVFDPFYEPFIGRARTALG